MMNYLQTRLLANPASYHLGKQLFRLSWRYMHQSKPVKLQYAPHAYSFDEAIKRIAEHDSKRLFARNQKASTDLVPQLNSQHPLKKILLPSFAVNAMVSSAQYTGLYGRYRTVTSTDSKGHVTTYTTIDWYPTFGTLMQCHYSLENGTHMTIYGGSQFYDATVESALSKQNYTNLLQDFEQDRIDKDILIDPFDKKDAYAQPIAQQRVYDAEVERAREMIMRMHASPLAMITTLSYEASIKINKYMLPAYALQYKDSPVRILSALTQQNRSVHGIAATSDLKVMSAVTTTALMITYLLPPQISLPARAFGIVFSALCSGLYSHYRLDIHHNIETTRIRILRETNDEISATFADRARIEATSRDHLLFKDKVSTIHVDDIHYQCLNLPHYSDLSEKEVLDACHQQLQKVHPDKGGSVADTIAVLNARAAFLSAFRAQKSAGFTRVHKRNYSIQVKMPPRSVYYPKTQELINSVFNHNYQHALNLIETGDAHPDGHDKNENTLLTEAIKQKNHEAAAFALNELQCSPDTSCDCPLHNTALHYAAESVAENDNAEESLALINLLINHGARINLINSKGATPLDMAKHDEIRRLLISHGAITHRTNTDPNNSMHWLRKIVGYGANERTLIENAKSSDATRTPLRRTP